jgi:hypothetical protein
MLIYLTKVNVDLHNAKLDKIKLLNISIGIVYKIVKLGPAIRTTDTEDE